MKRYRSKPVEVEAWQWKGGFPLHDPTLQAWSDQGLRIEHIRHRQLPGTEHLKIITHEGPLLVKVGDWIVKGTKGEFYVERPDTFTDKHEEVGVTPSVHRVQT